MLFDFTISVTFIAFRCYRRGRYVGLPNWAVLLSWVMLFNNKKQEGISHARTIYCKQTFSQNVNGRGTLL